MPTARVRRHDTEAAMKKAQIWGAAAGAISAFLAPAPVKAADPGAPSSGFYAGAHVGYMFGNATATLADPIGMMTSGGTTVFGGVFGGVQTGYEHIFPSHLMLGVELDASFPDYMDLAPILSYRFTPSVSANEQLEFLSTLRGRIGYAMGSWTPYVTGGLALGSFREELNNTGVGLDAVQPGNLHLGYAIGAGVDKAIDKRWSARFEYLYTSLGLTGYQFNSQARYDSQYDFQRFRLGLNYHFGVDSEEKKDDKQEVDRGPGTWEVHGQTTFIFAGYPAFSSAIPDGPQSLPQLGQSRQTWSSSLYFGLRLWEGGTLYYNPELLQGFGVASTTGLAGFANGEAQKSNFPYLQYSTSRLFLRQAFGFGGETEKIGSDFGQVSEVEDVSRIEFQIGRFAVHDLFDTNDYAQDPRTDFMNWSIWASGAFDYAADKIGLTYGITAELNQADWAFRVGYFLVGDHPNSDVYDMNLFSRGMYDAELELRYKLLDRPGVAKFGGWMHESFAGNYNDANNLIFNTGLDPTTAITQTRTGRAMWGYYVNWQQEITDDIGAFARWSWNDGQSEISAFTDINASLSGGLSIKGVRWGRPDDTLGIAGAINYISPQFQTFLAQGGTGILIGDGQLDYAPEHVLEAYYAFQIKKGVVVTADYQYFADPAYNTDRGPVHMFSGRFHASF
jgi:high affinity Mn2+ porin